MKQEFTLAAILLVVIVAGLIGFAFSQFPPQPIQAAIVVCPATMDAVIASAQGDVYDMAGATEYQAPEFAYLTDYAVQGDVILNPAFKDAPADFAAVQKDSASQKQAWEVFTALIPPQDREMVTQYHVFTDGTGETLAAASQNEGDLTHWGLEIDTADLEDRDALMFTLIHEYGHILTLDATQMEPDQEVMDNPTDPELLKQKAAACPNFFTGWGCSYADSYVNVFYNRFWLDINDEWAQIDALQYQEDQIPYYEALHAFYLKYQDQFLDDYSVTHPDEDIAEAFAYFAFSPKPAGTSIKEQKILFFYEYPELVGLRGNILSGACVIGK